MRTGQKWLTAAVTILGAALMPLAFIVMLLTVNRVLWPYMGDWAWSVPIGTELGFTGLFLLDLLLEWLQRPNPWLRVPPYVFAAASLWLNIAAAHGSAAAAVGHAVLPLVFFGYLLAAKAAIRSLSVSDAARARKTAHADARAHARDILRAELGRAWRIHAPVLLRRQLRTGRLPAAVFAAIDSGVGYGGATVWEPAVESWVTGALTRGDMVKASVSQVRRDIVTASQPTPQASESAPPQRQKKPVSDRQKRLTKASRLVAANPGIQAPELAGKLDVSVRTAERYIADARRPRLVAGEG